MTRPACKCLWLPGLLVGLFWGRSSSLSICLHQCSCDIYVILAWILAPLVAALSVGCLLVPGPVFLGLPRHLLRGGDPLNLDRIKLFNGQAMTARDHQGLLKGLQASDVVGLTCKLPAHEQWTPIHFP